MTLFANTLADNRGQFKFDVGHYVEVKNNKTGKIDLVFRYDNVSVSLYADDVRDAIKRFVSMFTPTTRFRVTQVSFA